MLTKVIQFMGPALKSPVGPLPRGADGSRYFIQWTFINTIMYQTGRWPGRVVSHKHLHGLQWGGSTQTLACSLGMDKGLLERIKNTRLPGRRASAAESWEFDGAGVNGVLPTTEPPSMASMTRRGMSQTDGMPVLQSQEETRNSAFGIRCGSPAQPFLLSGPVSSSENGNNTSPSPCYAGHPVPICSPFPIPKAAHFPDEEAGSQQAHSVLRPWC